MIILGLDTSQKYLTLCLSQDDEIIFDYSLMCPNKQSTKLFDVLSDLLRESNIKNEMIDLFAVTVGPGSFTGVRIGMTAIKTMAQILNKPVIGLTTLELIAYQSSISDMIICSTLIHVKNEIYFAFYRFNPVLTQISDISFGKIDDLLSVLEQVEAEKIFLVGEAAYKHEEKLHDKLNDKIVTPISKFTHIKGSDITLRASEKHLEGSISDCYNITPLYVKDYFNPNKRIFPIETN